MSDLQDLIHKTSIDCIEKGQRMEQERIIKLLTTTHEGCVAMMNCVDENDVDGLINLIKEKN